MKARLFFVLTALASLSAPALAQPSRDSADYGSEPSTTEDRRVLHIFARCLADRESNGARALLAADFRTEQYRTALRRYAVNNWTCAPRGRLRFGGVLFAGELAEALLAEAVPRGSLAARIAVDPTRPALMARDQLELMSLCVVRAAPAQAEVLFASQIGDADESAAVGALMPNVRECLAAGVNARLNRPGLRAMLALAAYRLVQHNAAPAAAGN